MQAQPTVCMYCGVRVNQKTGVCYACGKTTPQPDQQVEQHSRTAYTQPVVHLQQETIQQPEIQSIPQPLSKKTGCLLIAALGVVLFIIGLQVHDTAGSFFMLFLFLCLIAAAVAWPLYVNQHEKNRQALIDQQASQHIPTTYTQPVVRQHVQQPTPARASAISSQPPSHGPFPAPSPASLALRAAVCFLRRLRET